MLDPLARDAVIYASTLSMLSLGLTLTYMTTRVPNFAHGSLATIGSYALLTFTSVLNWNAYYSIPAAITLSGGAAVAFYLLALRPLIRRGASFVHQMIATIAYELVLLASLNIYADVLSRTFRVTSRDVLLRRFDVQIQGFGPGVLLASILMVAVTLTLLLLLLHKTRFGVAMRASIENPTLAGALGVNVQLVYLFSWFLAGGLAGASGVLLGLWYQQDPAFGSRMLVSVFASSILGGLSSIYGAVLGGYVVGLLEIYGIFLASRVWPWILPYRIIFPLLIMSVTLLIFPRGLAGVQLSSLLARFRRSGGSVEV
ncbi:MAG: branched-chain amino acid ABC transporter permease [Thaumarchaeota archaeon]|nr:branched-chain amino acid ABC transporter permease [Candidatus Calditenuaceae archaeon]MDW8041776.1 branched-chain amino acid ABC transporter permease [Nitrososphaerota archaeon]